MQRCLRIAGAAAARCALRRWRQEAGAHDVVMSGAGLLRAGAAGLPPTNPVRRQSTAPDKRFHCSVCKKAFRLEMAAKLHVQQVHGGEGAVEAGAGPGQQEEQAAQTPVGVFRNAPPQAPTVVSAVQPEVHDRQRREKPAPKPLHEAEREVPSLVMERMLSVWDDIGVKRIGNQFVHSSMVMRVFAARPSDGAEPLYGALSPEGESPFEGGAAPDGTSGPSAADEGNIYSLSMSDAFAMATSEAFGPCRPARCPNPFLMKVARETGKAAPRVEAAEELTAPVTPFGQLPLFGQAGAPPVPAPPETTHEASTDTAAASGDGNLVSSPFAAGVDDSPFAGTVTTPFADAGYSPFATAEETPAPVAATPDTAAAVEPLITAAAAAATYAPSPFLSGATAAAASPFAAAASPFAASPFATADAAVASAGDFFGGEAAFAPPVALPVVAEAPPAHVCALCEKSFATYEGFRMHSKAKHDLDLPKKTDARKQRSVPDLPAYIPSPVDLAMTSPFGSSGASTAWKDVELTPYAQSMSNMTIAGKVVDVSGSDDGSVLLAIHVSSTDTSTAEIISVRCSAEAMMAVDRPLARNDFVFACGSLRLLPVQSEATNKVFASPVVFVTSPTGIVARLS